MGSARARCGPTPGRFRKLARAMPRARARAKGRGVSSPPSSSPPPARARGVGGQAPAHPNRPRGEAAPPNACAWRT
eukprot:1710102-Lingulodinium_polyedra.AAC.1